MSNVNKPATTPIIKSNTMRTAKVLGIFVLYSKKLTKGFIIKARIKAMINGYVTDEIKYIMMGVTMIMTRTNKNLRVA